ncbi:MAG: 4-hydroxy-3-methylbut-2-enyl diphosphate reductase [Arsenophonus endosymbiont of Ceratovacuna japonica]
MQILLANPRGFCAGVNRAISIVEYALSLYDTSIYVLHEIVHNYYLINNLRQQGVIFVEQISEVPDDAILIFSAHGVSQKIRQEAKKRNLTMLIDATCPLVTKVHMEVVRASNKGKEVIIIGYFGHPEINGIIGQYHNLTGGIYIVENIKDVLKLQVKDANNLCFITQTTLSIDSVSHIINALNNRFPNIVGPYKSNICYATINRQKAVLELMNKVDIMFIIGSQNSSNANRLFELAQKSDKPSYLIDSYNDIKKHWLNDIRIIGLTAGASTPDILISQVIKRLRYLGVNNVIELPGNKENVIFKLPKELYFNIHLK